MNISFAMTTKQVRERTKTVTRRLGWEWLVEAVKRGERPELQPIEKGQGLKKGEKVQKIEGPIRVIGARIESLNCMDDGGYYGMEETRKEGFPEMTPKQFIAMFCEHNGCQPWD